MATVAKIVRTVYIGDAASLLKTHAQIGASARKAAAEVSLAGKQSATALDQQNKATLNLGKAAKIGSLVMGAAFVSMIKKSMDFSEALSQVKAVTAASDADMAKLAKAAQDAGEAFGQFTATQAANALEELGKAGLNADDSIAALNGTMGLAAADAMDLTDAAEYVAQGMSMFALGGKEATHVANVLARAAGAAVGSAYEMGEGLNNVGSVANSLGISIDETATTLAVFAQNGIRGAEGGTQLKTMLMRLMNPSRQAQQAMKELGLEVYNAKGEFVGMPSIFNQLQTALEGKTNAEKDSTMATIFGTRAVLGANIAAKEGAKGWYAMADNMARFGSAQEIAHQRTDNLKGDLRKLAGTWENLGIAVGATVDGPLRTGVWVLRELVTAAKNYPQATASIMGTATALGAIALVGPKIRALGTTTRISSMKMVSGLKSVGVQARQTAVEVRALQVQAGASNFMAKFSGGLAGAGSIGKIALNGIKGAASGLVNFLGGPLGIALGVTTIAMGEMADQAHKSAGRVETLTAALQETGEAANQRTFVILRQQFEEMNRTLFGWGDGAKQNAEKLGIAIDDVVLAVQKGGSELDALYAKLGQMEREGTVITNYGRSMNDTAVSAQHLRGDIEQLAKEYDSASNAVKKMREVEEASIPVMDADYYKKKELGQATGELSDAERRAANEARGLVDALREVTNQALNNLDANIQNEQAIDDLAASIKQNGRNLDINTQKGRDNMNAVKQLIQAKLKLIDSMDAENVGAAAVRQKTLEVTQAFMKEAAQADLTNKQVAELAETYFNIPSKKATTLSAPGAKATKVALEGIVYEQRKISGKTVWVNTNTNAPVTTAKIRALLNAAQSKTVTIKTMHVDQYTTSVKNRTPVAVSGFAQGGFGTAGYTSRVSQFGGGNRNIMWPTPTGYALWNEPHLPWEAYISGDPKLKSRSLQIWAETGRRLGVEGFAEGGIKDFTRVVPTSIGGMQTLIGVVQSEVARILAEMRRQTQSQANITINNPVADPAVKQIREASKLIGLGLG